MLGLIEPLIHLLFTLGLTWQGRKVLQDLLQKRLDHKPKLPSVHCFTLPTALNGSFLCTIADGMFPAGS